VLEYPNMNRQFDNLTASELACPRCRKAQPVRERLLLVLPHSELFDYRCTVCGESCGSREVKVNPLVARAAQAVAQRARRRAPRGHLGQ
jgi:hypothetical protein